MHSAANREFGFTNEWNFNRRFSGSTIYLPQEPVTHRPQLVVLGQWVIDYETVCSDKAIHLLLQARYRHAAPFTGSAWRWQERISPRVLFATLVAPTLDRFL